MKKLLTLLFLILLTKITAFSRTISTEINQDSTVSITYSELKYVNLIFAEHEKYLKENILYKKQINNYIELCNNYEAIDSLKTLQIKELNDSYNKKINDLNSEIKSKNRALTCWKVGGFTVSVGLLLFLILK